MLIIPVAIVALMFGTMMQDVVNKGKPVDPWQAIVTVENGR